MKKVIIIFMFMAALGILVVANTYSGDDAGLKLYYNDYLSMKIENCKRTASLFDTCYNFRMYEVIKMRAEQAKFYEDNREELIDMMLLNGVGKKPHKIDYFLINQFKDRRELTEKRASH